MNEKKTREPVPSRGRRYNGQEKKDVVKAYVKLAKEGVSMTAAAKRLDVSYQTLARWVRE